MRILRGTLTQLAGEGRRTLQIPQIALSSRRDFQPEYEEIPDEWILHVHSGCQRLCVSGRERPHAFWFLSRAGLKPIGKHFIRHLKILHTNVEHGKSFLKMLKGRGRDGMRELKGILLI